MHSEKKDKNVIAAGHICLDITPDLELDQENRQIRGELLAPGKLLRIGKAEVSAGGSVVNTGIGIKRMGGNVELMGSVGKDEFGRIVLSQMEKYGVGTESITHSEKASTAYSIIFAPPGTDRIIFHYEGTNAWFGEEDIDFKKLEDASLFHFGYPPLMRGMYENTGEKFIRLLRTVKETGTAVSVDTAMFEEESDAGREDWDSILRQSLPLTDFFMPSAEELCLMLDRKRYHEWLERAGRRDVTEILDIEKDIRPLAEKLLTYGAGAVVIKCGAKGIYFRSAGKERLVQAGGGIGQQIAVSWADREAFEKSYRADKVVSGTGAGDTAIAGFITALLAGEPWQECLHLAAAAGAMCVGVYDALSALTPLSKMKEKIKAGWEKIPGKGDD